VTEPAPDLAHQTDVDTGLLASHSTDVVVLPRETTDDGRGVYHDSVVTLVKEFKWLGVTAAFAHDREQRTWLGQKSFVPDLAAFAVGIASNAGWSALWWLLRSRKSTVSVRVTVARRRELPSGATWEEYVIEGKVGDVVEALAAIETPDPELVKRFDEKAEAPSSLD
jgi:hypothetical protein